MPTTANPYERISAGQLRKGDVIVHNETGAELPVQLTYPHDQLIMVWTGPTNCTGIPARTSVRILRRDLAKAGA